MAEIRKDAKKRVLKEGEYQRENGTYEYKWRDRNGVRHSIYAKTLEELREKELDVLRDVLDGMDFDGHNMTLDDLYARWVQVKRGIKEVTFNKYKHDYNQKERSYAEVCKMGKPKKVGNIRFCGVMRRYIY